MWIRLNLSLGCFFLLSRLPSASKNHWATLQLFLNLDDLCGEAQQRPAAPTNWILMSPRLPAWSKIQPIYGAKQRRSFLPTLPFFLGAVFGPKKSNFPKLVKTMGNQKSDPISSPRSTPCSCELIFTWADFEARFLHSDLLRNSSLRIGSWLASGIQGALQCAGIIMQFTNFACMNQKMRCQMTSFLFPSYFVYPFSFWVDSLKGTPLLAKLGELL